MGVGSDSASTVFDLAYTLISSILPILADLWSKFAFAFFLDEGCYLIYYNYIRREATLRRSKIPAPERQRRSRLARLAHFNRLVRGTLSVRKLTCGKAHCRCTRGEPHLALYLSQSHKGKPRQLYVPKEWEARVRTAVKDYQDLQALVEELSELEWQRLSRKED